jgi:DNA/RNA endonuclease G (NUC1)
MKSDINLKFYKTICKTLAKLVTKKYLADEKFNIQSTEFIGTEPLHNYPSSVLELCLKT